MKFLRNIKTFENDTNAKNILKKKITPKLKLEWLEVFEDTKKELLDLMQQIDSTDKEIN